MVSMSAILLGMLGISLATHTASAAYESDWTQIDGALIQVSFDGTKLCGVNAANNIFCATDNLTTKPNWRLIPGGLKWVAVWGDNLWGVNGNDEIYYGKSSGDPQWLKQEGALKQISTDGKQICGVNRNNDIYCADQGITTATPNWRQLPGKLTDLDLTDGVIFGTAPDDSIWYGMSDGEPSFTKVNGLLTQLSYDGEMLCGVNRQQNIWCSNNNNMQANPSWRQLPGALVQLDVNAGRIFGVNSAGMIYHKWLTQPPSGPKGWTQAQGKLSQINFDGATVCGVNSNDDIYCADTGLDTATPAWRQLEGKLIQVVVWGDLLFGVNRQNNIYVGQSSGPAQWVQLPGALKQISTDGKQICGVNSNNQIYCADEKITSNPNWRLIPGTLVNVVVANGVLYGTAPDEGIWRGRAHSKDPQWIKMDGMLKNLEFDGDKLCGTNYEDDTWCTEDGMSTGNPVWQRISGQLSYVSINSGHLFGVDAASNIYNRASI